MSATIRPLRSTRAPGSMVASADQLATQAGMAVYALGGNAVDAAIATNAAMAVTSPHLCGMGGDLFALVHDGTRTGGDLPPPVFALNASGRAGAGSDSAPLRLEGRSTMPLRHDVRVVTVPGCVDGWCALHARFARLPLGQLFGPAIQLAEGGFPASALLVAALDRADQEGRENLVELASQARRAGDRVRRPGAARALRAIAGSGRDGFYLGEFGNGLRELGAGMGGHGADLFDGADLATPGATWVEPLSRPAFSTMLHTIPPNSQGYLLLGAAELADRLGLPPDPSDPQWAHLLIEAATAAGHARPSELCEGADADGLLRRIAGEFSSIDRARATGRPVPMSDGDTTFLCAVDEHRMGVSLIQSNASGFGSMLIEPNTQINLHNRGLGFSIEQGHPGELLPGRRPPHTLSPALATNFDGSLSAVFGTMGGDAQPQILLQIAARLFLHRQSPATAIEAGRWVLQGPETGFDTWTSEHGPSVAVEGHGPPGWPEGLRGRGHAVQVLAPYDSGFGHAHAILVEPGGMLSGACDPRTVVGSVAGL